MIALLGIVTVLLEYIDWLIPIMPALCSMLLATYYAFNYAGIIGRGLAWVHTKCAGVEKDVERKSLKCLESVHVAIRRKTLYTPKF